MRAEQVAAGQREGDEQQVAGHQLGEHTAQRQEAGGIDQAADRAQREDTVLVVGRPRHGAELQRQASKTTSAARSAATVSMPSPAAGDTMPTCGVRPRLPSARPSAAHTAISGVER